MNNDENDLIYRLRKRAEIRRQIPTRKSVQNNEPDRIADLLEEAANEIEKLRNNTRLTWEVNDLPYKQDYAGSSPAPSTKIKTVGGGIGRRAVFKIQCPKGRVGSSPTWPTKHKITWKVKSVGSRWLKTSRYGFLL